MLLRPIFVRRAFRAALMVSALFSASASWAQSPESDERMAAPAMMFSPLTWSALAEPIFPVQGADGLYHLSYEFKLSNDLGTDISIDAVEVLDSRTHLPTGDNRVIAQDGLEITGKLRLLKVPSVDQTQLSTDFGTELDSGQGGIMYFDLTYPSIEAIPKRVVHRITVQYLLKGKQTNQSWTTEDRGIDVSTRPAARIRPPLEGEGWIDGNGAGPIISAHRYTAFPSNGKLHAMERFAIDFMKLDREGKTSTGDPNVLENYFGYGRNVHSATNGRVVEARDGLPDQIPNGLGSLDKYEDFAGNHVIVAFEAGKYALYAHLKPGSVKVRKGERIRAGQVLGQLGNSGNTDGPHLHFQIMDTPSSLNTTALPFVFDHLVYQGHVPEAFDPANDGLTKGKAVQIDTGLAGWRVNQMPLSLDVVGFPQVPAGPHRAFPQD